MGAPGYTPYSDELPPHAPMPGAPPYPEAPEQPPPAVGERPPRTSFVLALAAAGLWAAVNVVLVLLVPGAARGVGGFVGGLVVSTVLTALAVWLVARRRRWSIWLLVLLAAPVFWVLRALATLVVP
jgi:hypothetical protein